MRTDLFQIVMLIKKKNIRWGDHIEGSICSYSNDTF
ncbi:MAG: hypothetical protein H6Q69_659 [Firmicutes bacterium]|nr:hypothetical protein [Bacillota bacterium]